VRTRVRDDGGVTGCVESACLERSGSVPSGTGGLGTAARPTAPSVFRWRDQDDRFHRTPGVHHTCRRRGSVPLVARAQQAEGSKNAHGIAAHRAATCFELSGVK
jgi:hypothetical protein